MRITHAILAGAMTALALTAAPALARHSDTPKPAEPAASEPSSSCSARQRMDDGTWAQLPCQETGSPAQAKPVRRGTQTASH